MRIWREGDRSVAMCERCRKKVRTRFEYRPFDLERPKVTVPDVLVAVCEECGEVAGIPYQSTPRIRQAREMALTKFEARVPRELVDAIYLVATKLETEPSSLTSALMRYYIHELGHSPGLATDIKKLAEAPLAKCPSKARVSVNIDREALEEAWTSARAVGMRNKGEMARGIILVATVDAEAGDIGSTDVQPSPERLIGLKAIAACSTRIGAVPEHEMGRAARPRHRHRSPRSKSKA